METRKQIFENKLKTIIQEEFISILEISKKKDQKIARRNRMSKTAKAIVDEGKNIIELLEKGVMKTKLRKLIQEELNNIIEISKKKDGKSMDVLKKEFVEINKKAIKDAKAINNELRKYIHEKKIGK